MEHFPACNACATLNYAGFSEGWRLPAQTPMGHTGACSGVPCGRGSPDPGSYCAPDRQLWDFGAEQCPIWGTGTEDDTYNCKTGYNTGSGTRCGDKIKANWDSYAAAANYWSATQRSATSAWRVSFGNANTDSTTKSTPFYVRCFLGHW